MDEQVNEHSDSKTAVFVVIYGLVRSTENKMFKLLFSWDGLQLFDLLLMVCTKITLETWSGMLHFHNTHTSIMGGLEGEKLRSPHLHWVVMRLARPATINKPWPLETTAVWLQLHKSIGNKHLCRVQLPSKKIIYIESNLHSSSSSIPDKENNKKKKHRLMAHWTFILDYELDQPLVNC